MKVKLLSHVRLFATPWTVAHQALQSMEFSRQDYWSGLPFPPPGDLPNPGIEPGSPARQAGALPSEPPGSELEIWKQYGCNVAWGGISQAAVIHKIPFWFFKLLKATSTIISLIFFFNLSFFHSISFASCILGLVVKNMSLKLLYFPNNWPFLKNHYKGISSKVCVCETVHFILY